MIGQNQQLTLLLPTVRSIQTWFRIRKIYKINIFANESFICNSQWKLLWKPWEPLSVCQSGSSLNQTSITVHSWLRKRGSCLTCFLLFSDIWKIIFQSSLSVPLHWPALVYPRDPWPLHSVESCWRSERRGAGLLPVVASQQLPIKQRCDLLGPLLPKISRIELNLSLAKKDVWFLIVLRPRTSLPCL